MWIYGGGGVDDMYGIVLLRSWGMFDGDEMVGREIRGGVV